MAPDAILLVDGQGLIRFANRQVEAVFGHQPHSMVGRSTEDLLPERFRTRHVEHRSGFSLTPASRAMGIGLDLWALRSDGTEVPVQVSLSPLTTSDGLCTVVMVRDMSLDRVVEKAHSAEVVMGETERIALELQQTVIDELFGAGITLQSLTRLVDDPISERLHGVVDALDGVIRQIRSALFHPPLPPTGS